MLALLQILFLLIVLPYILFAVVMIKIWDAVCSLIHPVGLMIAVWLASTGYILLPSSFPSDRPWLSIVEQVAQFRILGYPTPVTLFAVAALVLVVSMFLRVKGSRTGDRP
ncbi:hypothetical protein NPS53_07970 [Pseudomonas putida]|uniref:hypothetical protein n=1 Tax=Pseudomonas putida TaxID=303 RepID=UPI002364229C|nr:hypothetical protein [Pseudomonas putida]MDD2139506.1 hypothetical protein [Pseudomonas putida]HDS1721834.1 hypothetical protein [Pseudomonas putida]